MAHQWRDDDDDIPARRPDRSLRSEVIAATVLALTAIAVVAWLLWVAP